MLLAALLLVSEAFRPPTPRKRSLRLSARPQPTQQRWSDRRTNQAIVSKWRRSPEPDIVYEVDRKCVAKHLPRGADAAYLRDVLSDAFGPLASVEVAPGDVAYVVFERSEDAAAATKQACACGAAPANGRSLRAPRPGATRRGARRRI